MTFLNKWLNEWKLFFLTYTIHLGAVYKQRIYVNTLILMIFREKIRVTFIQLEKSKLDEAHNWFMITLLLTLNILSLNFYFFLKAPLSLPTFSGDFKIPLVSCYCYLNFRTFQCLYDLSFNSVLMLWLTQIQWPLYSSLEIH